MQFLVFNAKFIICTQLKGFWQIACGVGDDRDSRQDERAEASRGKYYIGRPAAYGPRTEGWVHCGTRAKVTRRKQSPPQRDIMGDLI